MSFMRAIKRLFAIRESFTSVHYINMTPEQADGMSKAFAMMDEAFKEMERVTGLRNPKA